MFVSWSSLAKGNATPVPATDAGIGGDEKDDEGRPISPEPFFVRSAPITSKRPGEPSRSRNPVQKIRWRARYTSNDIVCVACGSTDHDAMLH